MYHEIPMERIGDPSDEAMSLFAYARGEHFVRRQPHAMYIVHALFRVGMKFAPITVFWCLARRIRPALGALNAT